MGKIKWGLVGATTIARDWMIPAMRRTGGEVVSIMSTDAQRGKAFAENSGLPIHTTELSKLLDGDIDAVYISTTNELHAQQALAALEAGKHVLCEKPLATSMKDAARMLEAANRSDRVFATNHHLRNAGTHRAMRQAVAEGAIGRPLFARVFHARYLPENLQGWRLNRPEAGAGVVLDITTHDIDTLRYLLAEEPRSVICMTQQGGLGQGAVEDGAMAIFEFENGLIAQTHDAFTSKYASTGLELHGTDGSLIGIDVMTQEPIGTVILRNALGERELEIDRGNLYERGLTLFTNAVEGKGEPSASGLDGYRSLAAGIAALESARSGSKVAIQA
jgi:1,5-anhydro-D-fructose reductase (1,5-anhydro-D-mannitol-forming)